MEYREDIPSLLTAEDESDHEEADVERFGFDDVDLPNIESQLEVFRQQWKDEIKETNSNQNDVEDERNKNEKEAAALFLMGSKLEQEGALYEAVNFYRRAMQLVPDIETRIQYPMRSPRERQESESSIDSYDGDEEMGLVTKFHKLHVDEKKLCYPNYQQRACHLSALPIEVIIYIFKWVVSTQLDMRSLESLALVCRGFYMCARDEELWRLACLRLWGNSTGKVKKYQTWRNMYLERPHLQFVGCYISKMSYIRQGEKSLDGFYSPWHHIEYYRYIRFFSEGQMLMMTSPEDPYVTLPTMKSYFSKTPGMMKGVFKLSGNRVTGVLKRVQVPEITSNYKYKRMKNQNIQNEIQQTFHIELEIHSVGKKNGHKLSWVHYSVRTVNKTSGEDNESDFEINNRSYPTLVFSRVKSFATDANTPLNV